MERLQHEQEDKAGFLKYRISKTIYCQDVEIQNIRLPQTPNIFVWKWKPKANGCNQNNVKMFGLHINYNMLWFNDF